MSKLITELKQEHSKLVQTLQEVKRLGISNPDAREMLIKAKNALLDHLKKEDEKLYPVLRNKAKQNSELNSILNVFAKDMEGVSKAAMDFFNKYENISASGIEFAKDFGGLYAALGNRIRKEEDILYKEFDKI